MPAPKEESDEDWNNCKEGLEGFHSWFPATVPAVILQFPLGKKPDALEVKCTHISESEKNSHMI